MAKRSTSPEPIHPLEPFVSLPKGARARRCQYVRHAKQQRPFTQCAKPAMADLDFCRTHRRMHGRVGPLAPAWKGGVSQDRLRIGDRWQSKLPSPIAADYLAALRDPKILSLEDEIALIDTRLGQLVQNVGRHDDWEAVKTTYARLVEAINASDSAALTQAMNDLKELAIGNVDVERSWTKVIRLTDRRRKLVESERRRMVEQHMFLTREEAHNMGAALMEICTRHVRDRDTLTAIMMDFRVIVEAQRGRLSERALEQ